MPIPASPIGYTLVYLVESTAGPVLVDAGWSHPDSWQALMAGLDFAGVAVSDIYGVLVTHHHPDHFGLAGQVREVSGAWVALHPADTAMLVRQRAETTPDATARTQRLTAGLVAAGAPPEEVTALGERVAGWLPPVTWLPDRELADGELADVPGRALRALWTPGHSPGHTCFYAETERLLLSGDHLLPGITPHVALFGPGDGDPLGDFLGSIDRISTLDVADVLPAHEHRFTGAAARARQIAGHHRERLAEVERALAGGAATVWEIAQRMQWNQPWAAMSVMNHRMALGEAAAHLRHLESRRRVRLAQAGPPARYELLASQMPNCATLRGHRTGPRESGS